ncbi:uncharacterized protein C2845_PM14G06160 [Panicum miliaceum]|uniref:Uncharacterized protein n=1 Tax=Panicum miliaceum TaxID=4540 RepID=A0A3L6PN96_PANMI|nr:uncharacterized protein C2845_PM14G06160 [Panicum miliaceum]
MGDERQQAGQTFAAAIMVSDGGGGGSREAAGKKRKASAEALVAMRREPRRGLGVAELERIRVALEVAERCYAVTAPAPAPHSLALPPSPTALAVVHGAGLAAVGNGAVHQLQMPRGYFAPYYVAAQQLFTSSGYPLPHQNGRQSAVTTTALPAAGQQAASSESSSSVYQERRQSHRRRAQPPRQQQPTGQTVPVPAPQQVAFVDLVDSDDDDGSGHAEELDLELRL